jgi:hypothetical protein
MPLAFLPHDRSDRVDDHTLVACLLITDQIGGSAKSHRVADGRLIRFESKTGVDILRQ